jgi:hypothetical protein
MSSAFQIGTEFDVIEDFAIENNPQSPILIADGLLTRAQVDDA